MTSPYLVCLLLALGSPLLATARLISGNTAQDEMAAQATAAATELSSTGGKPFTIVSRELIPAIKQVTDFSSWMKDIKDTTPVSDISMPGTHDSTTWKLAVYTYRDWAWTQRQDLWQQMMGGVRFLDIRLSHVGEELLCWSTGQGSRSEEVYFDEVVETVYNFLTTYPSETIVMSIKRVENDSPKGSFSDVVAWYLRYSKQKTTGVVFPAELYYNSTAVPTMAKARGKVILVKRFGIDSSAAPANKALLAGGLDVSSGWMDNWKLFSIALTPTNSTVYVQDQYNVVDGHDCLGGESIKKLSIQEFLLKAKSGKRPQDWYFNFVNIQNKHACDVWAAALRMDAWLMDEVQKNYQNVALGIQIVDFVWTDDVPSSWFLVPYIISSQRPGTWKERKGYRLA